MEEDRNQEVFKYVCKLCNKRYPCGKSLGGHMRSHVTADARKNKLMSSLKKVPNFADFEEDEQDGDDDDDEIFNQNVNVGNAGYGLRENPKKTWRMVDSNLINNNSNNYPEKLQQNNNNSNYQGNYNQQERVCKQCGKGFHSLKALCGHMSIHSDKDRHFKEEDDISWSSDSKDQLFLAIESHCDDNKSKPQTRSSLSRYRSLTYVGALTNNGGSSLSNISEIDQLEQEEVAMCLMMLSRDSSGSKGCFNLAGESSDNNSVILEGGITKNVLVAKEKVDCNNVKNVDQEMDNSDSGYFENGAKEVESDGSVDGFVKNFGFSKNKFEVGSRLVNCFGDENDSKKRKIRDVGSFGFDSPDKNEDYSSKKIKQDYFYSSKNSPQKVINNKYECWICNKSFKTHQALGGHIISHKKNYENSLDSSNSAKFNPKNLGGSTTTKKGGASKKVKGHKCPYCPKVFKSGQALGGHKRTHMMGSNNVVLHSDGRLNHVPASAPPPEPELNQPLIDLNLPAPVEEDASGNSQFLAW